MLKPYWAVLSLGTVAFGCSEIEAPLTPAAIEVVLGDGQSGAVGQSLDLPFVVRVTDRRGDGYLGVDVDFTVTSGGGALNDEWEVCANPQEWGGPTPTVSAGALSGGYAWMHMTPTMFGTTTVEARVESLPPVTFTVEVDEPEVTVEALEPYQREVVAGPQRRQNLGIFVKDELGDPLPGASIRWEVVSGSGDIDHLGPGCDYEKSAPGTLTSRTSLTRENYGGESFSGVSFRATAFGATTVTASVPGAGAAPATFTFDATLLEIVLGEIAPDEFKFMGPEFTPDVDVPVGATVEWEIAVTNARILSTAAPSGGASFDSGDLAGGDRFQFVPDVAGTWSYVDEVSGETGTLTAS